MKLRSIGVVIANRTLELRENGEERDVIVEFGRPQPFPDGVDYYCPYRITGVGKAKISYAGGVDAVQALLLAMQKAGVDLLFLQRAHADQLTWNGERNLGLPLPETVADIGWTNRP
jgi:hypothetical protein